jgi:hypothetical protein
MKAALAAFFIVLAIANCALFESAIGGKAHVPHCPCNDRFMQPLERAQASLIPRHIKSY